jgi:hypothetical protein
MEMLLSLCFDAQKGGEFFKTQERFSKANFHQ